MILIPLSVNTAVRNKVAVADMQTLNTRFEPKELCIDDITSHVLEGHALNPAHLVLDAQGRSIRSNEAFVKAQLVFLDIDNSVTEGKTKRRKIEAEGYLPFDRVTADAWIRENAFMVYTTPSHTAEWHRYRLVFCLPDVVSDFNHYRQIIAAFVERFHADKQCKSPVHVYYGNTAAEIVPFGKILSDDFVAGTLKRAEHLKREVRAIEPRINGNVTEEVCREILAAIPPKLDYIDWVRVISGVASHFDEETAERLINEWSPGKAGEVAYKIRKRLASVSFGTVVWLARQHGWEDTNYIITRKRGPKGSQAPIGVYRLAPYRLTDAGNAERLVDAFDGQLLFDRVRNKWLTYDGRHWHEDQLSNVTARAVERLRQIEGEAEGIDNPDVVDAIEKWSKKSESRTAVDNALNLASRGTRLAVLSSDFDKDSMLLNLANCVFDLRTFEATAHDPRHRMTKLLDIEFDNEATCPRWEAFLNWAFMGDDEMLTFIRRSVGYSLTGLTDEQYYWFCYGTGSNGKSVFFNVLQMLFGDYYHKSPVEMLLIARNGGAEKSSNDLAAIVGKRLIVTDEFPKDRRLDTERIKNLTGGDVITARYLFQEFFQFRSQGKLWIYGNHYPQLPERDKGIWRRTLIVPFENSVAEDEQRPMSLILDEFREELPGILKWALDGLWEYRNEPDRLAIPEKVVKATGAFRDASDILAPFLEEYIADADTNILLPSAEIYSLYAEWAKANNEHVWSKNKLTRMLTERGWKSTTRDRRTLFIGKQLTSKSAPPGGFF